MKFLEVKLPPAGAGGEDSRENNSETAGIIAVLLWGFGMGRAWIERDKKSVSMRRQSVTVGGMVRDASGRGVGPLRRRR
jgi:hypothetical protein